MRPLVILLMCVAHMGCVAANSVPIRIVDWPSRSSDALDDLLYETSAMTGLEFKLVDYDYGAIRIKTEDPNILGWPDDHECTILAGWTYEHEGCERFLWASPRPIVLAHELGHTLGLDHVDDPDDVMHKWVSDTAVSFTFDQMDKVLEGVEELHRCRLRGTKK